MNPFLTQKRPIDAIRVLGETMILESGLSSAYEIIEKFFDSFSSLGKFKNQGSLDQDLVLAMNLIDMSSQNLAIQPTPHIIDGFKVIEVF